MSTTIEDIKGIEIASDFFNQDDNSLNPIKLELFSHKSKDYRVSLLYGKNGSGKSTIARGFWEYLNPNDNTDISTFNFLTKNNSSVKITDYPTAEQAPTTKKKIHIFNENYINKLIKFGQTTDGLDTIVLIGKDVDIQNQIDLKNQELIQRQKEQEPKATEFANQYKVHTNEKCPDYWKEKLISILKDDKGWAGRERIIKGNRQNSPVNENTIDEIIKEQLNSNETKDSLFPIYTEKLKLYQQIGVNSSPIKITIPQISILENIEELSKALLQITVTKPELSDREKILLERFGNNTLNQARSFLGNTIDICPTCLQDISQEYCTSKIESITKILNKDVEDFHAKLQQLIIREQDTTQYQMFQIVNQESYNALITSISNLNVAIQDHNRIIEDKKNNPYVSIEYNPKNSVSELYKTVCENRTALENKLKEYNDVCKHKGNAKDSLSVLNKKIAHIEIRENYQKYIQQLKEQKEKEIELTTLRNIIEQLTCEIATLENKKGKQEIARRIINQSLAYIFFDNQRLVLDLVGNEYILKVRGKKVKPSQVSTGERNAIALAYFFIHLAEGKDENSLFSDEMFLIIDDPISSFDIENKVGIMSFLRWRLGEVLTGCDTTKLLLMTHDIGVMFDFSKLFEEISKQCKKHNLKSDFISYYLENKKIDSFSYRKHNEYGKLLNCIYEYAKNPIDNEIHDIGNIMRRVLEFFSTHEYRMGIEEISRDEDVLELLNSNTTTNLTEYFCNFMYRLILNGESHFEEKARGNPENSPFNYFDIAEKAKTSQYLLVFLYKLNPLHILSHLRKEQNTQSYENIENEIKGWEKNIEETLSTV